MGSRANILIVDMAFRRVIDSLCETVFGLPRVLEGSALPRKLHLVARWSDWAQKGGRVLEQVRSRVEEPFLEH